MKIRKIYFAMILGLMFPFTSCDDDLTQLPTNATAVEAGFQNINDFEQAVKGLYSGFRRDGYFGATSANASILFIPDVMSDDVVINSNGRRSRETFYDWRHDEDSSSEAFWLSAYKVIQRANLMLEKIDVIAGNPREPYIRSQALSARAIAHFDLAKFYAESPAQASDGDLGIPYVTSTASDAEPTRATLGETYTNILNDLNEAISLWESNGLTSDGRGFIDVNVMHAILSRIELYRGNYQASLDAANKVSGEVASLDNFPLVWKDASEQGVLWKIVVVEPDDVTIGVAWLQESPDGIRSEYNVDYGLFQQYGDNDIRKDVYFETSDFNGVAYNHIVKYRGRLTGNANEVDPKVIRYAEILLNKAEAFAELNQDGAALEALDELRAQRYTDFSGGSESGQALKDAIALERRLELAFEGQRFFDLKRKGLPINRSEFGDEADGGGIGAEFGSLSADDHRFNMAIGADEINANANITQNPGY